MYTLSLVGSLIASILLLSSGIFVLYKDWNDQVSRYYSNVVLGGFLILSTMFITYAFPDSPYLTQINRITQIGTSITFSGIFVLAFVFPKREKKFPFKYTALMILPAYASGGIALLTDLTITRAYFKDGVLVRDFQFFYGIYAAIAFAYILFGIVNFTIKYIRTKVEIYRLQMRFVFLGTGVAMAIAAVFSIILPRFFNYADMYVLGPSLASFIGIGSLYYSIISYSLMDITTAIHKTTTYTAISAAIFGPIYLVVTGHQGNFMGMSVLPAYLVAGAVVLIFLLFYIYVQPVIDKAFKRKQYLFEEIIDRFTREVESLRDYRSIIQRSVDVLQESMFLKSAAFISYDPGTRRYELFYQKGDKNPVTPLERGSNVIRWFVRNQEILHLDRIYTDDKNFADIREEFLDFFTKNGIKLVLPVYHEKRVLGFICLGDKDSLVSFKPDEIEKLNTFLGSSNIHISNALTYEESKRQQLIARTLDLSSEILSKSLPTALPNLLGIKFGAFVIPRYGSAVDYFDFIRPGNQGVGLIATDISGVGINSALYAVLLRSAFQSCIEEAPSAYSVMQKLNNVIFRYSEGSGGLLTAYYMYYDLRSMRLIYSNAGFPPLDLFRIEKNDFDALDTEGIPLGYDPTASYGMGRTNLLRGDIGAVYSKALISSKNQKGEPFGLLQLRGIIRDHRADRPDEIVEAIKERFVAHLGLNSPEADIAVILFKIV
ncbi:MAG: hypothetical protein EPN93_06570 [Spirochaetes bacterium]|nr:MAG: hypothetical protein EPN93_06570 [Spirochaetota bacterium]